MTIQYSIKPVSPGSHYFDLSMRIETPDSKGQKLYLPAWIPGSYLIRDFARNVVELSAEDSVGKPLDVVKLDKDSWQVEPCASAMVLRYKVYANDLSVRSAFLNDRRGFFNGTSVFLCAEGLEKLACEVDIQAPDFAGNWQLATSLPSAGAAKWGFGAYRAETYDELLDHPVEMGPLEIVSFEVFGAPHHLVLNGRCRINAERLQKDLIEVCQTQARRFNPEGELPFDEYWFLTAVVPDSWGGLEHMNSTALICPPEGLPSLGMAEADEDYTRFLNLCSHEYFHCWNVKRIQPLAFQPFDYRRENYTSLLWAFEGITSYYDERGTQQAGCISLEQWLELIGQAVTRIQRGVGRQRQTLFESSFDAWTKFYKQDENAANAIVSYYGKGGLLALCLDLSMRKASNSRVCLDDLMRLLWLRYGETRVGVPEDAYPALIAELLENVSASATETLALLELGVNSVEELPLAELLNDFSVSLNWRPRLSASDLGGTAPSGNVPLSEHGVALSAVHSRGVEIKRVDEGGAVALAGLNAGDVIVAIDEVQATPARLDSLRFRHAGALVTLHVFRREELLQYSVTLQDAPETTAWLSLDDSDCVETLARRFAWLGE